MLGQPHNTKNLRVIETARTLKEINTAAKEGYRPLVKPVIPSKEIHQMVGVFQHRVTGEIELSGDVRGRLGEDYECVIPYRTFYPYKFPSPYAAYLVPPNISEGEAVWLKDVIEDIVAVFGNQGWHPRLESSEAVWLNGEFKITFDPEVYAPRLIG
jgi:hypothetical protein